MPSPFSITSAHTSLAAEQIKALDNEVKHQLQIDHVNITRHLIESGHDSKKRPYIMMVLFKGGDKKDYLNYSLNAMEVAVHQRYVASKHGLDQAFIWDGYPPHQVRRYLKMFNSHH
jgi:hypothetical protein